MAGLRSTVCFMAIFVILPLSAKSDTKLECADCSGGVREGCCMWECHGGHFTGRGCEGEAVINITGAVLAISTGTCPPATCCPDESDCNGPMEDNHPSHMNQTITACNGKRECSNLVAVNAYIIKCGSEVSNYEVIYYDCVSENPPTTTSLTTTETHTSTNPPSTSPPVGTESSTITSSSTKTPELSTSTSEMTTVGITTDMTTSSQTPTDEGGLSGGAIAGIVIGIILLILILLIIGFCYMVRRKNPNWPQSHNWKEPFINFKHYLPGDIELPDVRDQIRKLTPGLSPSPARPSTANTNGITREKKVTVVKTLQDAVKDDNVYYTIDEQTQRTRRSRADSFNSVDQDFDSDKDEDETGGAGEKRGAPPGGSVEKYPGLSRDTSVRSENTYDVIKDDEKKPSFKKHQYESVKGSFDEKKDRVSMDQPVMMVSNSEYDAFPENDSAKKAESGDVMFMCDNSEYDTQENSSPLAKSPSILPDNDKAVYSEVNKQSSKRPSNKRHGSGGAGDGAGTTGGQKEQITMVENATYEEHELKDPPSGRNTYYNCVLPQEKVND